MAADNYSDVVKALAQQIVNTCMKLIAAKVPGLVSSTNIDASMISGDTSSIGGGGGGIGGTVTADGVIGLNQAIADAISNSSINIDQIVKFDENVGLVVKNITIDEADVNNLKASIAQIASAEIGKATIDAAKIRDLEAEVAKIAVSNIGKAAIGTANINWANINWAEVQNLVGENSIITKGVNGELYVRDLAVTEANMVSLTVGELMVKGEDGHFYSVSVDENGEIVTTKKEISNGDIADNSIDGATKIIENSITVSRLNAQDIFANSALVNELIAKNISVSDLFAREATINAINATEITSGSKLALSVQGQAQNAVLNMSDDSIAAKVTRSETFQSAIDSSIGYRVEIVSTTDVISRDVPSTTLTAKVWKGNQDVTDTFRNSNFNWKRVSNDKTADTRWNNQHKAMKSITVNTQDVVYSATYNCELVMEV